MVYPKSLEAMFRQHVALSLSVEGTRSDKKQASLPHATSVDDEAHAIPGVKLRL